jgi:hypothetical protein
MAKNDVVLVDSIVQERVKDGFPSKQLDEVFEYFAFEQLLKDFDLSRDEIDTGWVDGRDDGGIDGFFIFVNGYMLQDLATFPWPKRNAEIEVQIITCKHHETFQQAPLNSLLASLPELLDLSKEDDYLKERYSADILQARTLLVAAYRHLSVARPSLNFRFSYASRGDSTQVAQNIQTRAEQIIGVAASLFSQCSASFEFVGAAELVALYRRTRSFSLDLRVIECITTEPGSYVGIVRLDDYFRFITDETGNLRRYLFDSNVRDYLGDNQVNEDIAASLSDAAAPDFWWLNNGITLLATGVTSAGKILHIQDIQIVNGLQTTQSIFRHFQAGSVISTGRGLLVKVVVSTDAAIRDRIIRATNNQSLVEVASLHATDKVQRDIEEVLERSEWYYERRKNYYRNIGKPAARFVTPMYLATGYVALVMKNPAVAILLKSKFMRTEQGYSSVFSETVPLKLWVSIVEVLKRVDVALGAVRQTQGSAGERFLAKWRYVVALLTTARLLGTFAYGMHELVALDPEKVTKDAILEMWQLVDSQRRIPSADREFKNQNFILQCCTVAATNYGVNDVEAVGRQRPATVNDATRRIKLTEEFISKVNSTLPAQPWKPGLHRVIAGQLGCQQREVSAAITELVSRGLRLQQKDGVVFDAEGKIVAIDTER